MHLSTGSFLWSFPSIGHVLAAFIIAYGCATSAYAADAVNINIASIEVLAREVIGVGSELAKRIVDFRGRYGKFKSIEALGDVRGIGPRLLTKNEAKIVIG